MSFNLSSAPFSSTSLWNQQVPTGATYAPLNWPTATGYNYAVTWSHDSPPVYVASSSDPVVQVSVPASWGWPGGTVSVHVPAGATGAPGGTGEVNPDQPIIIIDGDTVYNFWRFNRTSNTTATAQAYGEANVVTGTGWGTSSQGAGIVAAGASELGGLLVQAQTDTGTIDHALQLAINSALLKPGFVAPAVGSDGSNPSGSVQEGQLLAIPPGTPMPSGLSPLGQEVFRALQQYGAYVTDNGTDQTAIRAQANAYSAATMNALRVDLNSILPMLDVVSGGTPATPTTPNVAPTVTQASASPGTGIEHAGDTITLMLGFSGAVTVTGTPTLSLNDGAKATYLGGSGTNTLTFQTTVASTNTATSALAITGVNLPNGANITDSSGVAANLSGAVQTLSGLQIDPILPAVTQATASPGTGTEHVGDAVTLTLGFNEAVTVTGTPTLSLNDGGTATYVGGSGTNTLTFQTTVASSNTATSALAITGVNLPNGANITDSFGVAANLSGAVQTLSGVQIDPILPTVTQASASPGTGIEHAGDTITLTLGFSGAVTVTGTPTLSLNDGAKATYLSGSGTNTLTFQTTVASTNTATSALAITGVNLPNGANITDSSGVAANLSGAVQTLSGLQIDPILPAVTQATASPGTGTEHVGDAVTLTVGFNEAVTVTGTPTLSLNDGGTATYVGGSGTNTLTFQTTVASTNTATSALAITGVNLPNGANITDSFGVAANLSGAVKTFTGVQVDPTSSTPTPPTTPPVATPVLTVADHTLSVSGRGGTVNLGVGVSTTDANDLVTVNVKGLPSYETITDGLGDTFKGKSVTLTAAQVESGLTLHSYYQGGHNPVSTLTLTANARDPVSGAVATSTSQTIAVKDPRPVATTTTHSPKPITVTDFSPATGTTSPSLASQGSRDHGSALLDQITDLAARGVAGSAPHRITATDHPPASGATTASLASQGFALLNQYLAGHTGGVDPGQIVAAASNGTAWNQDSLLTRPQH